MRRVMFNSVGQKLSAKEREEQTERSIKNLHSALEIVQQHNDTEKKALRPNGIHKEDIKQNLPANQQEKPRNYKFETEKMLINDNQAAVNERQFKFGLKKLLELESKEPTEILLSLDNPRSGFMELLNSDYISPMMIDLLLKVLSKVCTAKELRILASLINKIISESPFVEKHLQQYMIHLQRINGIENNIDSSLESILLFLSKFQQIQPVTASEVLTFIIPALKTTLEKLKKRNIIIRPHIYCEIETLQTSKESVLEEYDGKTRKKISKYEQIHSEQPPEDYRIIPILPTKEDFTNKRPFLRPNIVRGSYMDATHYLDVQFRLLREDYVRPLRESVEIFKISSKDSTKRISVYKNVQVLCPYNTEGGLVHLISFDAKPFHNVQWEVSKRFLLGSLLCLSCDNFENMLFATVAKRDPSELKKGKLEIHFEQLGEQIFSISPSESFVMVESEAYFEAFRHTLASLQKMDENTLPLKDYIVNVKKSVKEPKYLKLHSSYDFCSTFESLSKAMAKRIRFPVLKTEEWPSNDDLGLDHSQYFALQAALTKEFAIIQGPPGTGKTYIGLKITQMLLENSDIWKSSKHSPILVVCYTNHALDQFLEGILSFTKNVVRIGGRSSNEAIKEYQLGELRQAARKARVVPRHIHFARQAIMQKIKVIEETINYYTDLIEHSTQRILPLTFLQPFMGRKHSKHFASSYRFNRYNMNYRFEVPNMDSSLHDWLNMPNMLGVLSYEEQDDDYDDEEIEEGKDAVENEEEDIDFELNLREIDDDEYSHINSGVKMNNKWKTIGKYRKQKQHYIRKQITHWDMMTVNEARKANLWKLQPSDRWRLYRLWIAQYVTNLLEIIAHFQRCYYDECEKLRELRTAEDKLLIRQAEVIGMTTTGAGKYHEYLQELQPQIVIVEEAAEVLEAHIVTSLTAETEHLILIGDHQQLKPSPTVYELAVRYSLDISLFERMINNGMSFLQLTKQHRMRPSIAKLLTPHIYKNLENHYSVENYENIAGLGNNMFFINHCYHEGNVADTKSHSNLHEANFLVALCRYLRLQGYNASNITVLTTYSGQMFTIKRLIKGQELLEGVRVTVVDNFQGEENDIILVSFVRSNDEGSMGFLKVSNRVCVALSRAKKGLYCIGNFELFAEESKLWKNIVVDLAERKAIGKSLILCCQNHPQIFNKVETANDFLKYSPDGGCSQPCNFRMTCGHVCSRLCHPNDKSHTQLQCKRNCDKILCDLKHECPKLCYEKCGVCIIPISKTRPLCGHTISVPCHLDPDKFHCPVLCNKKLTCGHVCQKQCYENCQPCLEKVKQMYDCGHQVMIPCYKTPPVTCPKPCNKVLSCGHNCKNECGINPCPPCKHSVKKSYSCGHENEVKCSDLLNNMGNCEEACGKKMDCTHECQSACSHEGNCGPCDHPCTRLLECSHRCVLKCHEICPSLCKICKTSVSNLARIWEKYKQDHNELYDISDDERFVAHYELNNDSSDDEYYEFRNRHHNELMDE